MRPLKYKGTPQQRNNEAQRHYKLSRKGKATQARYYKSNAKKAASKRWRENPKNRVKHLAHQIFYMAQKIARRSRQPCEKCGKKNAYAHHDDYSKPFIIHWLCGFHHRQIHLLSTKS